MKASKKDDELIRVMWRQGRSQSAISMALGPLWSVNRVASRISALGLRALPRLNRPPRKKSATWTPAPQTQKASSETRPVSIIELTGVTCRWPLWAHGAAPGLYCGSFVAAGAGPYCPTHAAWAFSGPRASGGVGFFSVAVGGRRPG